MDPSLPLMYDWARRTRERLFEYTQSLPSEVYLQDQPGLPSSSLRDIHAHVANMYEWFVGRYGLGGSSSLLCHPQQRLHTQLESKPSSRWSAPKPNG